MDIKTANYNAINFDASSFTESELIQLYQMMLRPRMIEEKMLILLRQGNISKWFSGIGQEAISVASVFSLKQDESIFPMHRNLGVFTGRNIPLSRLFLQWQGKSGGFTNGRDRSFHFGAPEFKIFGMISHLGPQLSLAGGVALSHLIRKEKKLSLAFTGEGATSEGEFHEALNVAAVWNLPVIFIVENNGYGLSTPSSEQFKCEHIADKGKGYGMESIILDGNNILEMCSNLRSIAESIRENPRPVLVECKTFRRRGHEEASGTKYVPGELMEYWEERDPVLNFQRFLLEEGVLSDEKVEGIRSGIKQEIDEHWQLAVNSPDIVPEREKEIVSIYKANKVPATTAQNQQEAKNLRLIDAISEGLDEAMMKYSDLVLMGQDIADYGGVFKITNGFLEKYGKDRVRNTPLCESAILGVGLGLSIAGIKSMVEMQFADFVSCGFNQIVNNLAKLHYRWEQNADVVVRMPTGGGVSAGPFHSQSNEAWFIHTPGLKVVYPSNPADAKGLLLASFADPNPVMFFEHKALYRSISGEVPSGYYEIEIGKASINRKGDDCTVVTYGMGVHWANEVCDELEINAEIVDLRTLNPIDWGTIMESVEKTGKLIILHEDTLIGGIGGEIAAYVAQHGFENLDAPIMRSASLDTPVPFAKALEDQFLPKSRFKEDITTLINY